MKSIAFLGGFSWKFHFKIRKSIIDPRKTKNEKLTNQGFGIFEYNILKTSRYYDYQKGAYHLLQ